MCCNSAIGTHTLLIVCRTVTREAPPPVTLCVHLPKCGRIWLGSAARNHCCRTTFAASPVPTQIRSAGTARHGGHRQAHHHTVHTWPSWVCKYCGMAAIRSTTRRHSSANCNDHHQASPTGSSRGEATSDQQQTLWLNPLTFSVMPVRPGRSENSSPATVHW